MKARGFLLGVLAVLCVLALVAAAPAAREGEVGRYQLFQGRFYHHISSAPDRLPESREEQVGVFLLDTASGDAWTLHQSNQLGPLWLAVEPPETPTPKTPHH